jgi:hypothetical protein
MNETLTYADLQDAGNAQAQLVLYAIARHVDWDTGEGYPEADDACHNGQVHAPARCAPILRNCRPMTASFRTERTSSDDDGHGQSSNLITLVGYAEWIAANRSGNGSVKSPHKP